MELLLGFKCGGDGRDWIILSVGFHAGKPCGWSRAYVISFYIQGLESSRPTMVVHDVGYHYRVLIGDYYRLLI